MTYILFKEFILKQLHFIIACLLAVAFAIGWAVTSSNYKDFKLEIVTKESEAKDAIIERQSEINKLTERLIAGREGLEIKYADSFKIISDQLADLRSNSSRVSDQTKEIRTNVVSSADTAYATKVATTYIDLYSEIKQHAVESSEQADRATAEAFKQYESCKLMVDEYNKFKDDSNEKKD